MKIESVIKHLVGGVAVYTWVAACSGSESATRQPPGTGGQGGVALDAFMDRGEGAPDGRGGGTPDALSDQAADTLDALTDPVRDANAQEGGCGTCTVAGPLKVVTADTDSAQALGGHVEVPPCDQAQQTYNGVELAVGPLFLTDMRAVEVGATLAVSVPAAETCNVPFGSTSPRFVVQLVVPSGTATGNFAMPLAGGRIFIPAGRKLCVQAAFCNGSEGNIYWSGFRPYS